VRNRRRDVGLKLLIASLNDSRENLESWRACLSKRGISKPLIDVLLAWGSVAWRD
jgi:hypothetical protein